MKTRQRHPSARQIHILLLGACFLTFCIQSTSSALERALFTGFQIDNRGQYFTYGGLRASLPNEAWPVQPFVQIFAMQQRFYTRSEGQILPGHLIQGAPTIGLSKQLGNLELQVSGGPSFLYSKTEELFEDDDGGLVREESISKRIGYAVTGYAQYWPETEPHGFEGLVSYTNLERIFYARLRWFYADYETQSGTPINPGIELLGVANADFKQGYAGALVQTEIQQLEILLKAGYQNNTTFHSGGYGGIELYFTF